METWSEDKIALFKEMISLSTSTDTRYKSLVNQVSEKELLAALIVEIRKMNIYLREGLGISSELDTDDTF